MYVIFNSASSRNEYQVYFLGSKGGQCAMLKTLPPSCSVVVKSENLNFLELSGPLQACNGTGLPLSFYYFMKLEHTETICTKILSPAIQTA